jgi:hypothetical protein
MYVSPLKNLIDTINNGTVVGEDKATSPPFFKKEMKEHQLKALHRMRLLETRNNIQLDGKLIDTSYGFLCDKVGSGKTVMLLGTICSNPVITGENSQRVLSMNSYEHVRSRIMAIVETNSHPSNVIVVPRSIFNQWENCIKEFTNFDYIKITSYSQIVSLSETQNVEPPPIILVPNTLYNDFARKFKNKFFSRVIFDEVDSLNIPSTEDINAYFYWFVSASIKNIIYNGRRNKGFLTDLLKNMQRNWLNSSLLFVKNPDQIVDQSMQLPEIITHIIKCKSNGVLNVLGNAISDEIKLMINAGDIVSAIKELNIYNGESENIITITTENLQKKLSNEEMKLTLLNSLVFPSENEKLKSIEAQEKIINELKTKINSIKERIESEELDPITYEEITNPVIVNCCQNKFEFTSIIEYISIQNKKKTRVDCPMCRAPNLSPQKLIYLHTIEPTEEIESQEYDYTKHDKYQNLEYILSNFIPQNKKILIMSEFDYFSSKLTDVLKNQDRKYMELHTAYVQVSKVVQHYKTGDVDVLLMNAREYGAGINLENTDHVIILHKMNSELEKQVIGRAQRLGRTTQLNVWKIYHSNEI